jgi:hypothetical protein
MPLHGAEHAAIYITDYLAALLVLVFVRSVSGRPERGRAAIRANAASVGTRRDRG